MLLTLSASCLKPLLRGQGPKDDPRAKGALAITDLPVYTRETLGLVGLNLSTDLLVGADRRTLEAIRERADKAACTCLLLMEADAQLLASADPAVAAAAVARGERVVEAAHILGCSAASIPLAGADDAAAMERAIERLKPIVARAEKRDLSLLISPGPGLTSRAERVTELLKRVGGFRIGTFPDFAFAAKTPDAAAYLHRLTPYATILSASTLSFTMPGEEPKPAKKPRKKAAKKAAAAAEVETDADDEGEPTPKAASPKVGKGKAAKAPDGLAEKIAAKIAQKMREEPAESEEDDEPDGPLDLGDDDGLGHLIDPDRAPIHTAYDLDSMLESILAVGYDGPLTLDYRGSGDPAMGVAHSRDAIIAALARIDLDS